MPELPEVESLRRFLARLNGREVSRVEVAAISALKTFEPPIDLLQGKRLAGIDRRGKYLIFDFSSDDDPLFLVLHLARGGWLRFHEQLKAGRAKPGRGPMALRLGFDDGSGIDVTEAGTEKRLAFWLVRDVESIDHVATLGPDPLDDSHSVAELAEILRGQKGQIKKVLTSQQVIAGVGNAYSDEALHIAKMSPYKGADKLSQDEAESLIVAVRQVFGDAVARSADLPASGLKSEKKSGMRVHGRKGEACPECGDTIREVSFATKSLQYCPTCQTGGKPLADRRMSRLLK